MKMIYLLICAATLLGSTGCVFWGGRDHADDQEHRRAVGHDEHPNGVDHGEYPGDMDHRENR